jgi:hypothetical protein
MILRKRQYGRNCKGNNIYLQQPGNKKTGRYGCLPKTIGDIRFSYEQKIFLII